MRNMRIIAISVMILAGYGCYFAARFYYAEGLVQEAMVPSVEQALTITPGRADLHERLARAVPERAIPELQAALRLNPREAGWWQELAVAQELQGDLTGTEQSLLRGAEVSNYYLPRWALADFYYRQQKRDPFGHWAHEALVIAPGDPTAIFQMAHVLGFSDQEIRSIVPSRPNVLSAFLIWLEQNQSNTVDIGRIVSELSTSDEQRQYTGAALGAADWLFRNGRATAAVKVWNNLVRAQETPLDEAIEPDTGHSLLDRELRQVVQTNAAAVFGWQPAGAADGITITPSRGGGGLLIEANGKEPDRVDLLGQNLVLLAGRRYRLSADYELQGAGVSGDGLWWEVAPLQGSAAATAAATKGMMQLHGGAAARGHFELVFAAPAETARLTLRVERPLGTMRLEGAVQLAQAGLELLAQ